METKAIRTFVAVLLTEDLISRISEVQERVKKFAPDVKWVDPKNLHITLKFLGDVQENDLPNVITTAEQLAGSTQRFDLAVSGLGAFPNPKRARVVWVGLSEGREKLAELSMQLDKKLAGLGFEEEEKEFKAHITIGRVKSEKNPGRLARGIEEVEAYDLGRQTVSTIAVMKSELRREGPIYTPLKVCELSSI